MKKHLKNEINESMQEIASRRPGRKKLVYDRNLRAIVAVDQDGNKTPTGLTMREANII